MLVKLHFTILEDIFILYNFKFCSDLYGDFVAPQLQLDLYVQSWLNGRGKLPSICTRRKQVVFQSLFRHSLSFFFVTRIRQLFRIYNVRSLKFDVANVNFASSQDHSKWAITNTKQSANRWVCIGDINRAVSIFFFLETFTLIKR